MRTGKDRLLTIWKSMKQRCDYEKSPSYKYYGAKGIKYDERWKKLSNFIEDMYTEDYDDNKTLDRIDPTKDYSIENCRWATKKQQSRNKTNTVYVLYKGEQRKLIELCEENNKDLKPVYARIYKLHWSVEKAIQTPIRGR